MINHLEKIRAHDWVAFLHSPRVCGSICGPWHSWIGLMTVGTFEGHQIIMGISVLHKDSRDQNRKRAGRQGCRLRPTLSQMSALNPSSPGHFGGGLKVAVDRMVSTPDLRRIPQVISCQSTFEGHDFQFSPCCGSYGPWNIPLTVRVHFKNISKKR